MFGGDLDISQRLTDIKCSVGAFTSTFTIWVGMLPPSAEASSEPSTQPHINQKVNWNLLEVLANLKRAAQCSCHSSHGLRNGRSKYCIRRAIVALHLPRKCRLVSCWSSHTGHEASLCLFNRARCRFNVLRPVRRPVSILTSLRDSRKA